MRNHMALGWFYSPAQIGRYTITRVTSLKPPRTQLKNPIAVLKQLNKHQWNMFLVGYCGWTWDAFDFFTVSLCVTSIAEEFKVEKSAVTWGITVTLMLRSLGALIFGSLADRYGRKWVMITNLCLLIIFELASGFTYTLSEFLAVRALYGIAMGGLLGSSAATAMEDLPYDARGILSGFFQQGYAMGYLLAAIFFRALVPTTPQKWRSLFWFGAGPPVLVIIWRFYLPETNHFQVMKAEREEKEAQYLESTGSGQKKPGALKAFLKDAGLAIRPNWFLFVYMVVLMSGLNSSSHGSQDFYPTFLQSQVNMTPTQVTVITVVGQIGALLGGTFVGYISTFTGRRLSMMVTCIFGGALVPAYVIPRNNSLIACAFFEQFFVGGAWGPIPVHLIELSPPALRSLIVGVTYQLGNLASSACATIQAVIGERFPLPPGPNGEARFDYGRVIGIFLGAVWAYMLVFLFVGPEMTQDERNEENALAAEYEQMRGRGVSLAEIGASRAKGIDVAKGRMNESVEEKGPSRYLEEA
ncbi:carboxylic acid transporter [Polychaeton citri CBS 116435]|uniref:Carboxylic acid transporter n=1 Tax=Polychaeton citri CBS 116435 TaxID=1314669 RepID=A0A9P4Q7Y3_9PEZI|nr:carboxylic acid transporter [Polychaeton citri CBS 116435]